MKFGLLVDGNDRPLERLDTLKGSGFETVALHFWQTVNGVDWPSLATGIFARGWAVSSLSVYGNPLEDSEAGQQTVKSWEVLVDQAPRLGAPLVTGFAGRLTGRSVPDSIEPWKAFFAPLVDRAEDRGLKIGFENCRMGGTWKTGNWNIAYTPDAWELMERAFPGRWGLEWEPGHAVLGLADPLVQIKDWLPRVLHLHGKDGKLDRTVLDRGAFGAKPFAKFCLPGEGDSDWGILLRTLEAAGYRGCLDLEPHSEPGEAPVAHSDLLKSLAYLKRVCSSEH